MKILSDLVVTDGMVSVSIKNLVRGIHTNIYSYT